MSTPPVLAIDLGTTSIRVATVTVNGCLSDIRRTPMVARDEGPGLQSWDGEQIAHAALQMASDVCAARRVAGVAIATQRTSCLLWSRRDGTPLSPVLGWADSRARPLERQLRKEGRSLTAGLTSGKLGYLLQALDPDLVRSRHGEIMAGTLDTWLVYLLTGGALHLTDHTSASHTGLFDLKSLDWSAELTEAVEIPINILPHPVCCDGPFSAPTILPGTPPLLAVVADQQASLLGHGCEMPGATKMTFGTLGAINVRLDCALPPPGSAGLFPNVALSNAQGTIYGAETSVLSAGSSIDWLVRIGVLEAAGSIDSVVDPTARRSQAVFVPALYGLGAPHWKPQARAAFFGLAGTDGPTDIARAVLEGIACATAEALELLETALDRHLDRIRIDGGLSASSAFCAILARVTQRQFLRAGSTEATLQGAALLAFRAAGIATAPVVDGVSIQPRDDVSDADRAAWRTARDHVLESVLTRRNSQSEG